jgi:addiction module HigA family antidote
MTALSPIIPGEILLEDFLKPHGLSQEQLSRDIDVPKSRVSSIVHGNRSITADTALRLGKYFGTTPEFWLNLQNEYDLRKERRGQWNETKNRIRVLRQPDDENLKKTA